MPKPLGSMPKRLDETSLPSSIAAWRPTRPAWPTKGDVMVLDPGASEFFKVMRNGGGNAPLRRK